MKTYSQILWSMDTVSFCYLVPVSHHSHSQEFLPMSNLNLPSVSSSHYPLSYHNTPCKKSHSSLLVAPFRHRKAAVIVNTASLVPIPGFPKAVVDFQEVASFERVTGWKVQLVDVYSDLED